MLSAYRNEMCTLLVLRSQIMAMIKENEGNEQDQQSTRRKLSTKSSSILHPK